MGEEVQSGDVGTPKLGVLELRNIVVVDGGQKLVLERGVSVLVFTEDSKLLSVTSVGLCDDSYSGADRMDWVDGGRTWNGERDSPVAHSLVLCVDDGEDQMAHIPVSAVQMDGGGVGVDLHFCSLDRFVGRLGVPHVHAVNIGVRKQRLVGAEGGHGGDEFGGGD